MHLAIFLRALALVLCLAAAGYGQWNAGTDLLDSPYKLPPEQSQFVGETVVCSIPLGPGARLFGTDTIDPNSNPVEFVTSEMDGPFRVFRTDETCNFISSWTTAVSSSATVTGIAVTTFPGDTYWMVAGQPNPRLLEFQLFTGVPTGNVCPLPPSPGPFGPLVIDSNEPSGRIAYVKDIAIDRIFGFNIVDCQPVCSFANPDNAGAGAFGNGLGDAARPDNCSDATLVLASGRFQEGQVTRVGQIDCSGAYCSDRWDLRQVAGFANGVDEFIPGGSFAGPSEIEYIVVVDNVTGEKRIVCKPVGLEDCQGNDPTGKSLWVNGEQGGVDYTVEIDSQGSLSTVIQRPVDANGKLVFHLDAGIPNQTTINQLLDLGQSCFPFVGGTQSVTANNIGKTNAIGASNYFGPLTPDPPRAPTFVDPTQTVVDTANLMVGSQWTGQAVVLNPAASSKKKVSLTNAIVYDIR